MDERYKKVCVLLDESDYDKFEAHLGEEFDKIILLPLDFSSLMRLTFLTPEIRYHKPRVDSELNDNEMTKHVYDQTMAFLTDLFSSEGRLRSTVARRSFPSEYFWHCLFTNIHRLVYYCRDFLSQYKVERVFLIKNNKREMIGELQVNLGSFTQIVCDYFERAGMPVTLIESKYSTVERRAESLKGVMAKWKKRIKNSYSFCCWKIKTFSGRDYSILLVNPTYDNKINFDFAHAYERSATPQAFVPHGLPHYHSIISLVKYLKQKKLLSAVSVTIGKKEYLLTINDFTVDVHKYFTPTVEQYLWDMDKTKNAIDVFWQNCPRHAEIKNLIFSFSPVFLYAYYLIEKIKAIGGQIVVWQHGGLNGYADHFYRYILDYKLADVFLAYGQSHVSELNSLTGENCDKNHIVGTNMIYKKKHCYRFSRHRKRPNGYYLLLAPQTNYYQSAVKWNASMQYGNIKNILIELLTGRYGRVAINGVKNHTMYKLLIKCLDPQKIDYTEMTIDEIIAERPNFLILDGVATTLIETITKFDGLIFVLNCQETWKIQAEALTALRKKVFYAVDTTDLFAQMSVNLLSEIPIQPPIDQSFRERYVQRFSYKKYKQALIN